MTVSAQELYERFPAIQNCQYLLFATHPLRELETRTSSDIAKHLTYYAFRSDVTEPLNIQGASAKDVHEMITFLENQVLENSLILTDEIVDRAKSSSQSITQWLQNSLKMGGNSLFDDEDNYFVPIPVALVAIVNFSQ
jgi:hypothetical protein